MAVANFKLNTFDTANNRPKLRDSELTEIIFKEVRVLDLQAPSHYTAADNNLSTHLAGIDAALLSAGSDSFLDSVFRIKDDGDETKELAFEVSAIASGATRTITMPNADVNLGLVLSAIQRDGSVAFTADQSLGSNKLINVADPTAAQDAATKAYVDTVLEGRAWKQSVKTATTGPITLSGAQTIDGIAVVAGERVLVKDQAAGENNGIYVVSASGWTRSSDANSAADLLAAAVFVEQGTANGDKQFAQVSDNITLGSTNLVWVVTSANHFAGDDMIALVGGSIRVDLATNAGLVSTNPGNSAGQLQINDDNSTLERNTNVLRVKDLGISTAKLADGAVTAIKIQANAVETAKINDDAVTAAKINADVAGFGLQQASNGSLETSVVRTLQNDDTVSFSAGEFGVIEADGNVVKVDAQDTLNLGSSFVVALETIAAGASGRFGVGSLVVSGYSGLSEEAPVYASRSAAGAYTQTLSGFVAGEHIILLGYAISATAIKFEPSYIAEF